jgi:dipeptidyl aminopeptidase/acylaminoacyl peptidase
VEVARGGTFGSPQPAGARIFLTLDSLTRPPEVVSIVVDATARPPAPEGVDPAAVVHTVTRFTEPSLQGVAFGATQELVVPGHDGRPVQMFVVSPPAGAKVHDGRGAVEPSVESADRPLALVHMIHGGPHGAFGDGWHWRWNSQVVAAQGYLTVMVNFHGSTGWGQAFTASILGRWGDQPLHDIMAVTDHLIASGRVDPGRMAITGGSYGGYLVAWLCTQTDRFACAINHAGVIDFQTQYATDVTQGRRRSMGGEPWDDLEGMDRYNPLRHARGFRTPMLVMHGERDYRVPSDQALEIYNVYKAMGLPARLVMFPDENHWILKPAASRVWYTEFVGWLKRWLG